MERKQWDWAINIGLLITVVGVVLGLLGYGVALAVEATFGQPHASLFESPFELLDLSSIAITQLLTAIVHIASGLTIYVKIYEEVWPFLLGASVAWIVAASVSSPVLARFRRSAESVRGQFRGTNESTWRNLIPRFVVLAWILASPLALFLVALTAAALTSILATIPIVGMVAGQHYIREWVVAPDICVPLRSRASILAASDETRKKIPAAQCIKILKDGTVLGQGRVVFATTKAAVLFSPSDGHVARVPLVDAVIEVLPDLPSRKEGQS